MTSFSYYVGSFYGNKISAEEFPSFEHKAYLKLQKFSNGRIDTEDAKRKYKLQIDDAICAMADVIYMIEKATEAGTGNVVSRSSGGESVTYAQSASIVSMVMSDKSAQERLLFDTARDYLTYTGLLYQGI